MATEDLPRITDKTHYGDMIEITCKNHPGAIWRTKNIAPIGCRSIFWSSADNYRAGYSYECDCPASDLIPVVDKV